MKFLSKYLFLSVLLLLFVSGAFMVLNHTGFALRLTSLIFWVLVISTVLYIWEAKVGK